MTLRLSAVAPYLLAGAVTNILFAWACAVWCGQFGSRWATATTTERWATPVPRDWPPTAAAHRTGAFGWTCWRGMDVRYGPEADVTVFRLEVNGYGWPARSLWCDKRNAPPEPPFTAVVSGLWVIHTGEVERLRIGPDIGLPYFPSCSGFAINTVVHAAAIWVVLVGPFALRRAHRRHRGRCGDCQYDLRGLPPGTPCPECGAAPPPNRVKP